MKAPDKKVSIARDYLLFSIVVSVLILALSVWFAVSVYKQYIVEEKFLLSSQASRIDKVLNDDFNQITNFMKLLGKLIVDNKPYDTDYIAHILSDYGNEFEIRSTASRTGFDWISSNDHITVNSSNGVLKHTIDVSMRQYAEKIRENPGKLYIDPASYGRISAEWIIPTAMGFNDLNGNYVGGVSLGLSINYLRDKINEEVNNKYAYYAILDDNFNIVLQASLDQVPLDNEFFHDHKANISGSIYNENNLLNDKIEAQNQIIYAYIVKMQDLPYTIMVGYDKNKHMIDILKKVYPIVLAMICIGIVFLIILRVFARNIIDPIVLLSEAADKISRGERSINFPENVPYEIYTSIE